MAGRQPQGRVSAAFPGLGEPAPRVEDRRLVTGQGRFVDDVALPDMAFACVVRSPEAHARIAAIDTTGALAAPGVLAVLTGDDYAADRLGLIPVDGIPNGLTGGDWFRTPFPALARERVRCVGQAVALVVAESILQARDAAELLAIDYESLPATVSLAAALHEEAPPVWPGCPDNVCFTHELGDARATQRALDQATHRVTRRIVNQRVAGNPLEPRACIGEYDAGTGRYHLTTATQTPHRLRNLLAEAILQVPTERVHVRAGDVGGGFGTKGNLYPEDILVLWAARRTGRPVKWLSDRSESFLADFHGRDQIADAELALDRDGRIMALRVSTYTNLGCQVGPSGAIPPFTGASLLSGVYAIPAMHVTVHGLLTHTATTTTYRGAGRPEANFLVERMIDIAATELGIDPVAIRRRNLIRPAQMPYTTAVGATYDCGDFPGVLDKALALADWEGFAGRRVASAAGGRLRGRGLAMFIETCAVFGEEMQIRFGADGRATVLAGTFPQGQGHETMYRQMLADWLGVAGDAVQIALGDTDVVPTGVGTYASRSMTVGGSALRAAADDVIRQARDLAARALEVAAEDLEFARGEFRVAGTGVTMSLPDVARLAHRGGAEGLTGKGRYDADQRNYPNGCQVAEVEIDPQTGHVCLVRHVGVDDVGRVLNPLLYEGQVRGGIAQGVGQALKEAVVHDENGQLLTGSFLDYAMPRALDFPEIRLDTHNTPTATNPLGVKGAGEVGTVGAPPAVINAVVNALSGHGIDDLAMPATPQKVWRAIQQATSR
jgi:carbon-monoxide dehydrogenase large subunit